MRRWRVTAVFLVSGFVLSRSMGLFLQVGQFLAKSEERYHDESYQTQLKLLLFPLVKSLSLDRPDPMSCPGRGAGLVRHGDCQDGG